MDTFLISWMLNQKVYVASFTEISKESFEQNETKWSVTKGTIRDTNQNEMMSRDMLWRSTIEKLLQWIFFCWRRLLVLMIGTIFKGQSRRQLTGWSWSKSGSYIVIRWLQLSKSAILRGNQASLTESCCSDRMISSATDSMCFSSLAADSRAVRLHCTLTSTSKGRPDFFPARDSICWMPISCFCHQLHTQHTLYFTNYYMSSQSERLL